VVESLTCPKCAEPVGTADRFCEVCGESLLQRRTPEGGPIGAAGPAGCVGCGAPDIDTEGFCVHCGRGQPAGRDRMEDDLGVVAGVSDRGKARARNEDSMAFAVVGRSGSEQGVVAVVCDGVASTERADSASQTAVDAALDVLIESVHDGKDATEALVSATAATYTAVRTLAKPESPDNAPSCTLVAAVVTPEEITVAWIGDSRAYWIGATPAKLTTDDTFAAQLVAAGLSEADALANVNAHALARWVGADADEGPPNLTSLKPDGPGTLVLCSDGLWNYLPEAGELAAKVPPGQPLAVASELTSIALEFGGHDNVTVVVVPFPPVRS
jgi:PPM family protein phosphatase